MYQTNEPIFYYIYWDTSSRNIHFNKSGWANRPLNTISLIFLTALIGVYIAKLQGIQTLKSGMLNLYQNKIPIYEIMSGASIAIAALLLIMPGFLTDSIGFLLLIPFTRKILFSFTLKHKKSRDTKDQKTIDGEIVDNQKDDL